MRASAARPLQELVSALTNARKELADRDKALQAEWHRGIVLQRMLGALHARSAVEQRWRARLGEALHAWHRLATLFDLESRLLLRAETHDEGRRAQLRVEARAAEAELRAETQAE
eukprot:3552169-Prymnesium_polylepis.1